MSRTPSNMRAIIYGANAAATCWNTAEFPSGCRNIGEPSKQYIYGLFYVSLALTRWTRKLLPCSRIPKVRHLGHSQNTGESPSQHQNMGEPSNHICMEHSTPLWSFLDKPGKYQDTLDDIKVNLCQGEIGRRPCINTQDTNHDLWLVPDSYRK